MPDAENWMVNVFPVVVVMSAGVVSSRQTQSRGFVTPLRVPEA